MLIQCSRCGAPLDVAEGAHIVKCNYCGSSNRIQDQRTLSSQTPPGWRPPAVWTPPTHAPYPSQPLGYHKTAANHWLWLYVALSVMVPFALALVFWFVRRTVQTSVAPKSGTFVEPAPTVPKLDCRDFATTQLTEDQASFLKRFPTAEVDKQTARLALTGCDYDSAFVEWNNEKTHVFNIRLFSSGAPDATAIISRCQPFFGRQFNTKNAGYRGAIYNADARLQLSPDARTLNVESHPNPGARTDWQARGDALWAVAKHVVLGAKLELTARQRPLLSGYSLERLAKIDTDVPVTKAVAHISKVLPGSTAKDVSDLRIVVLIDHPWFGQADLTWKNEENGPLSTLSVGHPVGTGNLADPQAVATCLEPVLGKAEARITNQLSQARTFFWKQKFPKEHGNITQTNFWYQLPGGKQRAVRFRAIVEQLAGCAR